MYVNILIFYLHVGSVTHTTHAFLLQNLRILAIAEVLKIFVPNTKPLINFAYILMIVCMFYFLHLINMSPGSK